MIDIVDIDHLDRLKTFEDLTIWTKGCTACNLRQSATEVVHYDGDPESSVMLVGIGPGQCEDGTQIPFCGNAELQRSRCVSCTGYSKCYSWQTGKTQHSPLVPKCTGYIQDPDADNIVPTKVSAGKFIIGGVRSAGQILDDLLDALGINRSKLFITNATLCKTNANSMPKPQEYNRCSSIRLATQRLVKPKLIITLGNDATSLYTGKKVTMSKTHGVSFKYQDDSFLSVVVYPTYHPAAILRIMLSTTRTVGMELENLKMQVKNMKIAMYMDFLGAFNSLDKQDLANIVQDSSRLVDGKIVSKIKSE